MSVITSDNGHFEDIKCPECKSIQQAQVLHTIPFNTYIHTCIHCGYIIMESEWERANVAE